MALVAAVAATPSATALFVTLFIKGRRMRFLLFFREDNAEPRHRLPAKAPFCGRD
jgi:hypothetical protein